MPDSPGTPSRLVPDERPRRLRDKRREAWYFYKGVLQNYDLPLLNVGGGVAESVIIIGA